MNIKKLTYKLLTAAALLMVTACADNEQIVPDSTNGAEMTGISATMTRAVNVAELKDYVGKKEFDNNDRAVFVTIKRTDNAIALFTYKDIEFVCAASKSDAGVTSIGWTRDKEKGTGGGTTNPDRIYWSDATNPHTFTGFCAPQQGTEPPFDWKKETVGGVEAYYGSIGNPTLTGEGNDTIDYRSTFDAEGHETLSGNVELCRNDILLTHSTEVKAQDAIAKLYFYHGLAQVRVIVNISDFAEGGGADTLSRVSDMVLKDMLTMYKWKQNSVATEKLADTDQEALDAIYTSSTPAYNQRKDFKLWIPEPKGVGYKSSRTFTFYGMVVPTEITSGQPLSFSFEVKYPDPMNPWQDDRKTVPNLKGHTYTAQISDIRFDAGKCTTISISLNHRNEKMTVAAEYDDWEFIDTPDQGSLKKNSTFLYSTARTDVTIHTDQGATVDDATWLYVDGTDGDKIKDVYGNDGSAEHPFTISTADQLLSFAYEVKEGFDFTGYTISLDAGITLQKTAARTKQEIRDQTSDEYAAASEAISWIGIGDTDHPFNGTFLGGMRFISRLYGSPFFYKLGPDALVEQLILDGVIDILGDGGFAELNEGQICACKVDGNVKSEGEKPVGSFVGTNSGLLFACYHIGDLTANRATAVGGLVGSNERPGKIVACYNAGKVTAHAGVTPYGVLGSGGLGSELSVIGCFYDKTKAPDITEVAPQTTRSADYPSAGKSTADLMRSSFVGDPESTDVECLNGIINHWVDHEEHEWASDERRERLRSHHYFSQPARYPHVY